MKRFKQIQHVAENDPLLGLRVVEFNPTELCNRQCVFCPRVDPEVFPNRNLHMDVTTVEKVVNDLVAHNYKGGIIFSGWGEPTLNRNLCQLIKVASKHYPVMLFTNGDKIFDSDWYTLNDFIEAGVSELYVDVYDDAAQHERWLPTIKKYQDRIKIHVSLKYEFPVHVFVNRAGTVLNSRVLNLPCFIPGSKAFIDWDGTLQLCCHDWTRTGAMGNVLETPLSVLWTGETFNKVRKQLMHDVRAKAGGPCSKCDAHGDQRNGEILKKIWAPIFS